MEFDITATLDKVDFGAQGMTEILQNIRTILSTVRCSVPLDRSFGVDLALLDSPLPAAKAKLTGEIIAAVGKYEPRAEVVEVIYDGDGLEGKLAPKVRVRVNG
jgi:phage baseplate assembly protein W